MRFTTCGIVLDEIFGPRNFIASVIWQKIFSDKELGAIPFGKS